jgi:hypothetical protein
MARRARRHAPSASSSRPDLGEGAQPLGCAPPSGTWRYVAEKEDSTRSRSGGNAPKHCRPLAEVRQEFFDRDRQSETGYARARTRLRRVGLTSQMSSRPWRRNRRPSSWVAAVASVSAGAHQSEGARRGGKEATEVACPDRDEGASEAQAPEEDLARQVKTRHAFPAALRGGRVLGGRAPEDAPGRGHEAVGKVSFKGAERRKTIRTAALRREAACRSSAKTRQ